MKLILMRHGDPGENKVLTQKAINSITKLTTQIASLPGEKEIFVGLGPLSNQTAQVISRIIHQPVNQEVYFGSLTREDESRYYDRARAVLRAATCETLIVVSKGEFLNGFIDFWIQNKSNISLRRGEAVMVTEDASIVRLT